VSVCGAKIILFTSPGLPDFFDTIYQSGGNLPNCHKMYQMAVIYSKRPNNILAFSSPRPSKINTNWNFWFWKLTIWQPCSPRWNKQGDQIGPIFRQLGDCLLWSSVLKITEVAQSVGLLFPRLRFVDKKWVGLHFGQFFHKLIWSPWKQTLLSANARQSDRIGRNFSIWDFSSQIYIRNY
jgi:hypothetical protein